MTKKIRKKLKYALLFFFVKMLITLSWYVPRRWWLYACGRMGALVYAFGGETPRRILRHLRMTFEKEKTPREIERIARQVYVYLGKNAGDVLRTFHINTMAQLNRFLIAEGVENYEKAVAKGRGVIFLTAHLGAFDLQAVFLALYGINLHILGTKLKSERLNDLLNKYRNKYGAVPIERGRQTLKMVKMLKSGGSISLLIDQDTDVDSIFVKFFGKICKTPAGAAILAQRLGSAVVPMFIFLDENYRQQFRILPEIPWIDTGDEKADIITNTQVYTNLIESQIREHPEQWVWMHERWKTPPPAENA